MTTRENVIKILEEIKPTMNLTDIQNIIDGGYMDSMELMSLISKLMDIFSFEMDIEWITPENFNSVDAIAALVDRVRH